MFFTKTWKDFYFFVPSTKTANLSAWRPPKRCWTGGSPVNRTIRGCLFSWMIQGFPDFGFSRTSRMKFCERRFFTCQSTYTVVKVDGATPKRWLSKGHDKPIHGSCAIYFPVCIYLLDFFKRKIFFNQNDVTAFSPTGKQKLDFRQFHKLAGGPWMNGQWTYPWDPKVATLR